MPITPRPFAPDTPLVTVTRSLSPVAEEATQRAWVTVLEERIRAELQTAGPGHCLRISDLPRPILTQLASNLHSNGHEAEIYLVDRAIGPEPWRVGVHKVVERRNETRSVVLALFPPDLQLAAGDSVDISTFRTIPISDLHRDVEASLLSKMTEEIRGACISVLNDLSRRGWSLSTSARLAFLVTVAQQPMSELWTVGAALFNVGLIPDFQLFRRPEEFHYRLGQKNIPIVSALSNEGATPLERILRLPVVDDSFRSKLLAFFEDRRPEAVNAWGSEVATKEEFA
jgi:DNA phosphorothioation-dependent restriction protein DptH